MADFSHPCLRPPIGGTPWNFVIKLTPQKLEGWGYRMVYHYANFIRFCMIHPCDGWTDKRTDEQAIACSALSIYSVSQKNPPLRCPDISHFPHKRLRIFNRFFTHLLHVSNYARLQIFIQLSPTLTKLCNIKGDYAVHIICAKCPKRARSDVCVSR